MSKPSKRSKANMQMAFLKANTEAAPDGKGKRREKASAKSKKEVNRPRLRKEHVPRHPALEFLKPYLGPCKEAETFEEKLIEHMDLKMMFDGFSGFEDGVLEVSEILDEYGIQRDSKQGQRILKTYIQHALEEFYGDFDRCVSCGICGKFFKPDYTLDYVNAVLSYVVVCPNCSDISPKARRKKRQGRGN